MSIAHIAIGSCDVYATANFLCQTMNWRLIDFPTNAPTEVAWIDVSPGHDQSQQIHVIHVEDFRIGAFEREFGRHFAIFQKAGDMKSAKRRITEHGGELIEPIRPTPFERFFFREPVNGYVFEVINQDQWANG